MLDQVRFILLTPKEYYYERETMQVGLPAGDHRIILVGYLDPPTITPGLGTITMPHSWASDPFPSRKLRWEIFTSVMIPKILRPYRYKVVGTSWDEVGGVIVALQFQYNVETRNKNHIKPISLPLEGCIDYEYYPRYQKDLSIVAENARCNELLLLCAGGGCNRLSYFHVPGASPSVRRKRTFSKLYASESTVKEVFRESKRQCFGVDLEKHFPKLDFSGNKKLELC